jgi:hypothetical protein
MELGEQPLHVAQWLLSINGIIFNKTIGTRMPWGAIPSLVSALVGIAGLFAGWIKWRDAELRRADVLMWANEVISALQTIFLLCILNDHHEKSSDSREEFRKFIFLTSILIERGRIFFKNEVIDDFGSHKEPAYRGYRPRILDPIVVAHQIACEWPNADAESRIRMRLIAEDCLKKFVSLAQKEVGRSRTASADTKSGGTGAHLHHLMNEISPNRLSKLRQQRSFK